MNMKLRILLTAISITCASLGMGAALEGTYDGKIAYVNIDTSQNGEITVGEVRVPYERSYKFSGDPTGTMAYEGTFNQASNQHTHEVGTLYITQSASSFTITVVPTNGPQLIFCFEGSYLDA
jgi:hypothetical protein